MRIDCITRHAVPLGWACRPVPVVCVPPPVRVDAPAPIEYTQDYADYVAERAQEREDERFTYADAIRARNIALVRAAEAARYLETAPVNGDAQASPAAPKQRTETPAERDTAPAVPTLAAKRVEFNRVVETLDNRGSLIDILL